MAQRRSPMLTYAASYYFRYLSVNVIVPSSFTSTNLDHQSLLLWLFIFQQERLLLTEVA